MRSDEMPQSQEEYEEILAELPDEQKASFERLVGTLRPWEKLDPELARCITISAHFGQMIQHPLVYAIPYMPGVEDGRLNGILRYKQEECEAAIKEGRWNTYVFLHERPYRLEALIKVEEHVKDDCEWWKLVGNAWTDSENIWQNYAEWEEILSNERGCRESMMDEEEQAYLATLPDELTIYRGYNMPANLSPDDLPIGFSWTLNRERAEWFAKRFASHRGTAYLTVAKVSKADVLAYFSGRGEEEIVALPENLRIEKVEVILDA